MTLVLALSAGLALLGALATLRAHRARRRRLRRRLLDPSHGSAPAPPTPRPGWRARRRRHRACGQVAHATAALRADARAGRPLDLAALPHPLAAELHAAHGDEAHDAVALLAFALRVAAAPGAVPARVLGELAERLEARDAASRVAQDMVRGAHVGLAALALAPLAAWAAWGARPEVAPWALTGVTIAWVLALRAFPGEERA